MGGRIAGIASSCAALVFLVLAAPAAGQHAVTTAAGGGPYGVPARSASIGQPAGVASDAAGNLYIADAAFNRIYKVATTGILTVVAGNGANGSSGDGGAATSAELSNPQGVAVDSAGNVFVSDTGNRAIRRIDARTGKISSLIRSYNNQGVFVDSGGNVFLAERDSCAIDEWVAASGEIITVAGLNYSRGCGYSGDGGPAASARLSSPSGIFVDAQGNLFIADTGNNVIREVDARSGNISTIAGNGKAGYAGDAGAATGAELNQPLGVWLDSSGSIFIADTGNNVIRKVTAGKIATVAGTGKPGYSGDGGLAVGAALSAPAGVAVDGQGNIFIADSSNLAVREVAAAGKKILTYAGNGWESYAGDGGPGANAQFNTPSSVLIDSAGNLYIADQFNNAVREVDAATGKIRTIAGTGKQGYSGDGGPATKAQLSQPNGVFVDATGNVFIADSGNNAIREVQAATGAISTVAGNGQWGYSGDGGPAASAQLNSPSGVFVDRAGNLFIADSNNNAIREVTASSGQIKTVAGNGQWGFSGDSGPATSAQLKGPTAVFADAAGNLFLADSGNNAVREVAASSGRIVTVAGTGAPGYSGDNGQAASAKLNTPSGIYVDGGGNLYIADTHNDAIRAVAARTQTITTVAGTGLPGYQDSATPASAQFDLPMGLSGDRLGNLLVADSSNQRIRKIAAILGTDPTPQAPPPTFSPGAGVYPKAQAVTLADAASGAAIYFTTDGTTPTAGSSRYKNPIAVSSGMKINAVATAAGYSPSPVAQASYTITAIAPPPTFAPPSGTYAGAQLVTVADAVAATIHYTTNGSTPTAASPTYTKPIPVSAATTLKAIAVAAGFANSTVSSAAYVIQAQVAAPAFSPAPRGYWTPQSVHLTDSTTGATIYYTVDGSTPTTKSNKYIGGGIPIAKTTTVKAIAAAAGGPSSAVASGLYTIDDASLVEQRALVQQGAGVQLAMQTFLSQISLAFNVLGPTIGLDSEMGDGGCGDPNYFMFNLTQFGHAGGMVPWSPVSPTSPGYATITFDNGCANPWMKDELTNWIADLSFPALDALQLNAATDESATFFSAGGSRIGTMRLTEAAQLNLAIGSSSISEGASAYGLGTFAPANGGPQAQLGLTCSINLLEFLGEGDPVSCYGAIAQDFPSLDLSLGFVVPLTFSPAVTPGVTWTGSQWVAVSGNGGIFTSANGSTWTAQPSGTTRNLKGVATSGSVLVVVGSGGTILSSTNGGTTWKAQSSGTGATLAAVAWSGSQFVAVGFGGTILTSPNGITWTTRASGTVLPLQSLAWSGSLFAAVGMEGIVLTSPDGVTWTPRQTGINDMLESVVWSGTQFVAVTGNGQIATSANGNAWSSYYTGESDSSPALMGVAWSAQKKLYVAVGQLGAILTSPSGLQGSWTAQTSGTNYNLRAVSWSGQQFVAIGTGNVVLTSPDGVAWKVQTGTPDYGVVVHFSSAASSAVSGPLGALQMTAPTIQTLAISGGTPYGGATFTGHYGDLAIFPPTPTGWTAIDTAHGQQFQIALGDNTSRILTGSITSAATGKTLAKLSLDQSGTGSITYSDGSRAAISNWLPAR